MNIKENEIGRMLFDEVDGFKAVLALTDEIDFRKTLQKKREFIPCGFFVVDNERADRH